LEQRRRDHRGLAWYGYQDSTGATYANYTYTRNVALGGASGLWSAGGVNGNVITLAAPWNGPTLPAGAAIRNTGDGRDESFRLVIDVPGDWSWLQYAGGSAARCCKAAPTRPRRSVLVRPM
jgi:hypothetical protein